MLQRIALPLVGLLALPLAAQQAAPAPADSPVLTIHTDSSMVNLPLVVRDKHGALVVNLTKDDLTVTEDGKPQTIRYFDQDKNLPLTLGLLVDVSGSQRDVLDDERTASQTFLDQMLGTQDKAFVIEFAREVDLLADPTGSHAKLQAALAKLAPMTSSGDSSGDPHDGQQSGHAHGGGTQLYDAVFLAADDVMKTQPNRKALIVLTDGVDRGSQETLAAAIEAAQRADTIVYAIYFAGSEPQHHGFGNGGGNQGGGGGRGGGSWPGGGGSGGGWPGGGGGWPGGGGNGGGRQGQGGGNDPHGHEEPRVDGRKILQRITDETGGGLFEVSKKQTVDSIYQQIAEELRNQFRLGYTPPTHDGPGFHRVEVIPKDKKMTVQTRSGYYSDK